MGEDFWVEPYDVGTWVRRYVGTRIVNGKLSNMMSLMKTSDDGLALIKKYEGLRLTAYKPVATEKYYTIGWGHYGPDVKKGQTITEHKANELLKQDVRVAEVALNNMGINFSQAQFDALVSWIFNLGAGAFATSTLKKRIVARSDDELIASEIVKWVNAGGKPLLGLKRRRVDEANLFCGRELYKVDIFGKIVRV